MTGTTGGMLAFFSYSRHDSKFALKLAKDLRQHGAHVWLDQLDIIPGNLWDSAVEQALANCPKMLVILSPDSIESTNVMDEVSFALDEHKVVLPVLYRDCKIPFRLRRVQYVDARTDYEGALQELLSVLGVRAAEKPTSTDQTPSSAAAFAAAVSGPDAHQVTKTDDQERIEREQARAAHITEQREEFDSARPLEEVGEEGVKQEPADEARISRSTEKVDAKAAKYGSLEGAGVAGATQKTKTRRAGRTLLIGGVAIAVVIGTVISVTSRKRERQTSPPVEEQKVQEQRIPPVQEQKVQEQTIPERSAPPEEKRASASEQNETMQWLMQFIRTYQGPDVDALRPYFTDPVSPYYSLPSADWAAISNDKTRYFSRFPTIQYRLVGQPEFKPTSEGEVLDFDLVYDNIRRDGQRASGTVHMTITVIHEGSARKIAGIREQRVRQ